MSKASTGNCGRCLSGKRVSIYRNDDVECLIAAIPRSHMHLRLALVLRDQVIVLHEATVAAIARAYIDIVAHPLRKGVYLVRKRLGSHEHKPGYARTQLIEECDEEDAVLAVEKLIGVASDAKDQI